MTNCYEYLFLVTIGDFKDSNVESFFTDTFKNVMSSKNTKEAIEIIKNNHIDVILIDSKITNSFEFIENIKNLNHKILIFFATQSLNNEDLLNSINVKVDGYLLENDSNDKLSKILNKNLLEYTEFYINNTDVMNDKKQLLNEIENNKLSILALVEIEDYQMMKNFYNEVLIKKIEKKLGNSLLSHFPQRNIFEKVYFVGNGRYALLGSFFDYINTQKNLKEVLTQFVSNVNKSILPMDDFECELNIILSFSYGKYMLYEDASHGLVEAVSKNKIIHNSNDASLRGQSKIKINSTIIKKIKIALDNYKIVSYFQPIINNKTKKIEKHESLVRLIDEDDKILFPFHFLNIAKEGNYYSKITHRILENTFKIVSKINTDVSINLSMVNIERTETREILFELLTEYKEYNNKIIFELLESERVKDFNTIEVFIRDVKKLGVRIAIDDFGTGYSNFERLMKFKPDIIKIDGSLIKNIEYDSFSKNLVETIAIFAKKQKIKTIAEFVETENIYNILTDMGIDYSQGYYFGRPEKLNF